MQETWDLATTKNLCYNKVDMNVAREKTALKRAADQDESFVDTSPAERVGFIWELTSELWSLRDKGCAERRLQRDGTNLVRQRG